MLGLEGLGRGYLELKLALCQGVRTDKVCFDISLIIMVIRVGLCLSRIDNQA